MTLLIDDEIESRKDKSSDLDNVLMLNVVKPSVTNELPIVPRPINFKHTLRILFEPLYCMRYLEAKDDPTQCDKQSYIAATAFELVKSTTEATLLFGYLLF